MMKGGGGGEREKRIGGGKGERESCGLHKLSYM